ncbi:MAG TPA: sigma-E factor regulatory protein RseB domain-containing protein [Micromonosporaceae bacterium]|nr:sigma-E factor regulatory protein RseB domain-containing protein [Micromonosporaceae bacterium]
MSRINRWMVPAGVAVAVLGVAAVTTALRASADPRLPERSAAQLLVDVQTARLEGLSGTVVLRSDLGLPALPLQIAGSGSGQLTALINGSHTLRVWYSGPDKTRIALLGTLGESDIIRNGRDVWLWSSAEQSATHRVLPEQAARSGVDGPILDPNLMPASPQELADKVLSILEPSTQVSTSGTTKVAGRAAYELILAPRDNDSLVSQVRIAIDGEKHLPLRLQVFAKGYGTPAFEVGFTQVSFQRPGDEHFKFNPPAGTQVQEEGAAPDQVGPDVKPDARGERRPDLKVPPAGKPDQPVADPDQGKSNVVGQAWTMVVVEKVSDGTNAADNPLGPFLTTLPAVSGDWGSGRLLRSKLFSALLTDDGRLLFGAVKPEKLYAVAASTK